MIYQETPARDDLRHLVASFWRFELELSDPSPLEHVVPPDGTVSIVWIAAHCMAAVLGPRTEALRMEAHAGVIYRGVRLWPGAVGPLFNLRAPDLRDVRAPLAGFAPARAAALTASLADVITEDEFVLRMSDLLTGWVRASSASIDPVVVEMTQYLIHPEPESIAQLAERLGLSYRQALRRFYEGVGLTPKEFARLRRIRAACVQAVAGQSPGWSAISADTGFADQSHLSREFTRTFGWTPRMVQEYLRRIDHRGVDV